MEPALSSNVLSYTELVQLYKSSSNCMGFCVSLGEFFEDGIAEVDDHIVPMLREHLGPSVYARVIPSYAILYWFASKVGERHVLLGCIKPTHYVHVTSLQLLTEVHMEFMIDDLKDYFCSNVLCTVQKLQSVNEDTIDGSNPLLEQQWMMDVAGEELLKCISSLSKVMVRGYS